VHFLITPSLPQSTLLNSSMRLVFRGVSKIHSSHHSKGCSFTLGSASQQKAHHRMCKGWMSLGLVLTGFLNIGNLSKSVVSQGGGCVPVAHLIRPCPAGSPQIPQGLGTTCKEPCHRKIKYKVAPQVSSSNKK
jgi:hypothetical protein